ncbi:MULTISPECIES: helix-turn-helix transcriptional regulator [unclassified Mesorhizobium]|uniref:helix-turn-helix transcriptional regulator n=1 Tax=unclassified Mesorhizobium TaxID=325217 RepID=UPI000FCCD2AA|nr:MULTISPECIES: helix-turn-helix transcriptional regulator [unclassified Mesorhizobium]RUW32580.1 XRE family transcriptional regulator [Mesorhizobium sp. M1E.F.Ca.ET.041.01.1.1]RWD84112.1 MAG: XRE family transcriptional regulator [Mesorhizobium sp.]RWD89714.1 MAG: XRE family transcriptional regulator [Mesorhizobium sp.]TIV48375.1 MAG: helix-turn-helix domain-containing protein [Mesorhizobium sp.]
MPVETTNKLGTFLRDRRMRLDPAAFGFATGRRRTQGLRREEVAQRANISPTWYTWLEQGRGGAPSADVLNRIATGLMLTEPEREHLFMLGLGRPPEVRYRNVDSVTPRLQRVLDAFDRSPAIIKTATWDVVAWNRAAAAMLTDYSKLPREQRNILRLMFGNPRVREAQDDWESVARFVVGSFRADAVRAGAGAEVTELVEELSRASPEFAALWRDNDVVAAHGEGVKRLRHPEIGLIELEFSVFAVDGRPELGMIVYNPVTRADAERIQSLIESRSAK